MAHTISKKDRHSYKLYSSSGDLFSNYFSTSNRDKWILQVTHRNPFTNDGGIEHVVRAELNKFLNIGFKVLTIFPVTDLDGYDGYICSICIDGKYICDAFIGSVVLIASNINLATTILHSAIGYEHNSILRFFLLLGSRHPLICWVHDFSYICKNFSKIKSLDICFDKPLSMKFCSTCDFFCDRLETENLYSALVRISDFIVFPSLRAKSNFRKSIQYTTNDLVLPHVNLTRLKESFPRLNYDFEKTGVAFFGHSVVHKGWLNFIRIVDDLYGTNKYDFFHIGTRHLYDQRVKHIEFSEINFSSDPVSILSNICDDNGIKFAFFWSEVEESYGLMIRQSLATRCIVLIRADHATYLDDIYPSEKIIPFDKIDDLSKYLSSDVDLNAVDHISSIIKYAYSESDFSLEPLSLINII